MTQWRIHIGAHKTATTHLQATLERISEALRQDGVAVATMTQLREATGPLLRRPGLRARLMPRVPGSDLATVLGALGRGADRVVLSEENWIGEAFEGAACPPYPDATRRLSRIVQALPGRDVTLYLAVRHPAEFASSVYAEALRHHPGKVDALRMRHYWLAAETPWSDLIARLQTACPSAAIVVWRYETYRARRQEITERLVGLNLPPLPEIDDPGLTVRPPPDDIAAAAPHRDRAAFHVLEGRSSLFSQAEYDRLTAHYAAECRLIAADPPRPIAGAL